MPSYGRRSRPAAKVFALSMVLLGLGADRSRAVPLAIANHSFESPIYGDGGYASNLAPASQGPWGWYLADASFIYNPPAVDYTGAFANGAPQGADGAQVGGVFGLGEYVIYQPLAGTDAVPGNGDDPVVEPGTVYTLTLAMGQRAVGNIFGGTWGGYDIQLRAGTGSGQILLGQETDVVTPPPGTFVTRTIVFECPTVAHPEAIGMPLVVLLRKTIVSSTATTEYDNVRLDAAKISPTLNSNFTESGGIDGADLSKWRTHYGADCLDATHGHGNANGDDYVDGADFLLWQRQLGVGGGATLPEPASTTLAALAALASGRRRRGKS